MEEKLKELINEVFDTYVKIATRNMEPGEPCYLECCHIPGVVEAVICSDVVKGLLREFWRRSPDACPLEDSLAEQQEKEWADWIADIFVPRLPIRSDLWDDVEQKHAVVVNQPSGRYLFNVLKKEYNLTKKTIQSNDHN